MKYMKKILATSIAGVGLFALAFLNPAFADTEIRTGDADSDVTITNKAGTNIAHVSGYGGSGADIKISGNGAFSDNTVYFTSDNDVTIDQRNDTDIDNNVNIDNNTGGNSASDNTGYKSYWYPKKHYGDGDVSIDTGDADANVSIKNEAGLNVAHVSGCSDCGGDADIKISGNGAYSDNTVKYRTDNDVTVDQDNDTDIDNDVDIDNNTGNNTVSDGGYDKYHYPKYKKPDYDHDGYKKDFDHGYKKDYDHDSYKKDYDHDYDKSYKKPSYKKGFDYDHGYKKDDGYKYFPKFKHSKSDGYDKDNCFPYDKLSYHKDYDSDTCDYGKKYDKYPLSYVPYHKKDYDHDKYDHDKKYYPKKHVVYKPVYKDYDHGYKKYDHDKKDYGKKYHDYSYKKDYDHGKKHVSKYDKCGYEGKKYDPFAYKKYDKKYDFGKLSYQPYNKYW